MDSSPSTSRLSALQRELLTSFFAKERRLFLTGGSALGGYHLLHRASEDLDLFAAGDVPLDEAELALKAAAAECGAALRETRRFHEFRRYLVERASEKTLVDLVLERAPQLIAEKLEFGAIRVDPLLEIAASTLCALLGRNEPKDLVDLQAILERGVALEEALRGAEKKDAGVSAANLAFVLDQWRIGAQAVLPGGVNPVRVEEFRRDLVSRLADLAFPGK